MHWFYLHRDVTLLGGVLGFLLLLNTQLEFVFVLGSPRAEERCCQGNRPPEVPGSNCTLEDLEMEL